MATAEKLTSAQFFRPEDLERLRITRDGTPIESPPRNRSLLRNFLGAMIVSLLCFVGGYYYLYNQGLLPHPNVPMMNLVILIEDAFTKH